MKFIQVPDDDPRAEFEINSYSTSVTSGDIQCHYLKRIAPKEKSNAEIAEAAWKENVAQKMFKALLDAVDVKDKALEERLKSLEKELRGI